MAVKELTPVKGVLNKITEFEFEAATAAGDGCVFTLPKTTDEYVVVLLYNSGGSNYNVTVKKPVKGSYAAAGGDEVHELAAGEFAVLRFESAKWAENDGSIKIVPANVAVKMAVLY